MSLRSSIYPVRLKGGGHHHALRWTGESMISCGNLAVSTTITPIVSVEIEMSIARPSMRIVVRVGTPGNNHLEYRGGEEVRHISMGLSKIEYTTHF